MEILNNNVRNKEILYFDDNLVVTSISGIKEEDIEVCIKTILEENPTITFETIQYSKDKQILYFYTTKKISIEKWNELKNKDRKELITVSDCVEEIERLLAYDSDKENTADREDIISLYDVEEVIKESYEKMNKKLEEYKKSIIRKLSQVWKANIKWIDLHAIDARNARLIWKCECDDALHISICSGNLLLNYMLLKNGDDLSLKPLESRDTNPNIRGIYAQGAIAIQNEKIKHLSYVTKDLIEFLNMLKELDNQFDRQKETILRPINSNCNVLITLERCTKGIKFYSQNNFISLKKDYYYNKYIHSDSHLLIQGDLIGNEEALFKNILVSISDCPEFIRKSLYERRSEQLKEELEQQALIQEALKQQQILQQQREEQSVQSVPKGPERNLKPKRGFWSRFK